MCQIKWSKSTVFFQFELIFRKGECHLLPGNMQDCSYFTHLLNKYLLGAYTLSGQQWTKQTEFPIFVQLLEVDSAERGNNEIDLVYSSVIHTKENKIKQGRTSLGEASERLHFSVSWRTPGCEKVDIWGEEYFIWGWGEEYSKWKGTRWWEVVLWRALTLSEAEGKTYMYILSRKESPCNRDRTRLSISLHKVIAGPFAEWVISSLSCILDRSDPECKPLTTVLPLQLLPAYQSSSLLIATMSWLTYFLLLQPPF